MTDDKTSTPANPRLVSEPRRLSVSDDLSGIPHNVVCPIFMGGVATGSGVHDQADAINRSSPIS